MAEAVQEQQQTHPQQPVQQQPAAELDMSDEAIIGRALDASPLPQRDPQTGRFLPQQQAQQQANAEQQAPVTEEVKPEAAVAEAEPDKQAAADEPVKWDEVKDVKIKVPMKDGEKEWEEEVTLEQLRAERMM